MSQWTLPCWFLIVCICSPKCQFQIRLYPRQEGIRRRMSGVNRQPTHMHLNKDCRVLVAGNWQFGQLIEALVEYSVEWAPVHRVMSSLLEQCPKMHSNSFHANSPHIPLDHNHPKNDKIKLMFIIYKKCTEFVTCAAAMASANHFMFNSK